MSEGGPDSPRRQPRQLAADAAAAAAVLVGGLVGGGGSNTPVPVVGTLIALGMVAAVYSWNDLAAGSRVEGTSVAGTTITGTRRVDVARATRVEVLQVRSTTYLRVGGPDGSIAVRDTVPGAVELIRGVVAERGPAVAVTGKAARALDLPPGVASPARGGGLLAKMVGLVALFVGSVVLGAALFYRS